MVEETLYETVQHRVVNGEFAPGQRLKAEDLRLPYGVSASTMREILFRLSTAGLVDFYEQRGFRMPIPSGELQHDLTQVRILLECQGACLSIRVGGLEWEARLLAAHHKLSHIESHADPENLTPEFLAMWSQAELGFHQTLIGNCKSDVLIQTHTMIYHRFRQQVIASGQQLYFVPANINEHQAILDATLNKDEDQACAAIHAHLQRNLLRPLLKDPQTYF